MDSQLTLVDSHSRSVPPPTGNILLVFDRDDMQNTTLYSRGSCYPSYVVSTVQDTTTLYAGNGACIATVTRRLLRRDQILLPGRKPINLASWLRAPILSSL
ncbi:hypothetical protein JVU11DRAFT_2833 [Chiua virens]|nr:hypothetical protein JVU11DRAFT_2833 [Chiua virens]